MIEVDIRRKAFGRAEVLRDVSFRLEAPERLAILGPSGIGKSTLLRIVAGLDGEFEGQVRRPERLAVVFQEPTLLPWRSLTENLTLTAGIGAAEAEAALSAVGLPGRGGDFPGQLSLGQQRRVALARALAAKPELLILDEPFASLDGRTLEEMLALTEGIVERLGVATLLVTHSQAEAERLAGRILTLGGSPATVTGDAPVPRG